MAATFPEFVYKILPASPPYPIPHTLPLSDLDTQDGFIHLSTLEQCPITADLFFADHTVIWILKISSDGVQGEGGDLRWADGLPGCVHLYAKEKGKWARLGDGVISDVLKFQKNTANEGWVEAFTRQGKNS
jgi:Protein of unknown function (DUF952)